MLKSVFDQLKLVSSKLYKLENKNYIVETTAVYNSSLHSVHIVCSFKIRCKVVLYPLDFLRGSGLGPETEVRTCFIQCSCVIYKEGTATGASLAQRCPAKL